MTLTTLFIYGTLKHGQNLAYLLQGQAFLGPVRTQPRFRLFSVHGQYPAMVEADRSDVAGPGLAIHGELWQVDATTLRELDRVEEVDQGVYERRTITLQDAATAQAYLWRLSVQNMADLGDCW